MNQIATGNGQWSDLLKENDFFKDHVHYLQVSQFLAFFVISDIYQSHPLELAPF